MTAREKGSVPLLELPYNAIGAAREIAQCQVAIPGGAKVPVKITMRSNSPALEIHIEGRTFVVLAQHMVQHAALALASERTLELIANEQHKECSAGAGAIFLAKYAPFDGVLWDMKCASCGFLVRVPEVAVHKMLTEMHQRAQASVAAESQA